MAEHGEDRGASRPDAPNGTDAPPPARGGPPRRNANRSPVEQNAPAKPAGDPPPGRISRRTLALFYALAGVGHFMFADALLTIMPRMVPFPRTVILLTGLFELAAAALLLARAAHLRRIAAVGLALYAVAVFPANIQHALNDLAGGGGLWPWYHVPRLLLQPILVLWPLHACRIIGRKEPR